MTACSAQSHAHIVRELHIHRAGLQLFKMPAHVDHADERRGGVDLTRPTISPEVDAVFGRHVEQLHEVSGRFLARLIEAHRQVAVDYAFARRQVVEHRKRHVLIGGKPVETDDGICRGGRDFPLPDRTNWWIVLAEGAGIQGEIVNVAESIVAHAHGIHARLIS